MSPEAERRALQIVVAVACLVPIVMGLLSIVRGPEILKGISSPAPIDLDSHFRYLSGLLLGIGLVYAWCVPRIQSKGAVFRALSVAVVTGGLARLLSLIEAGPPGSGHLFGLVMELGVVPLLVLWQMRIARRCTESG